MTSTEIGKLEGKIQILKGKTCILLFICYIDLASRGWR